MDVQGRSGGTGSYTDRRIASQLTTLTAADMHATSSFLIKVLLVTAAGVCSAAGDDGWSLLGRVWSDCSSRTGEDTFSCLRGRALAALDRAVRSDLRLSENVLLQRTREDNGRALTQQELESPEDGLFFERLARFFSSHVLKVELPKFTSNELQKGVEEGRGKMKKMMGSMMMMGAMKAAMVIPMVMGGLFLLAGKAFIIAKIALVLALVITAKKLFGQKDEGHSGGHGGGGGWDRRSLSSHDIVYSAYSPQAA